MNVFKDAWRIARRICFAVGLLLAFFAVIELFRAGVFFYRLNHVLGWAFAALVAAVAIGLPLYVWIVLTSYPKVLTPPSLPPLEEAGYKDLRAYCKYLVQYMLRLTENPNLDERSARVVQEGLADMEDVLGSHPLLDDLRRAMARAETDVIAPSTLR